MKILFAADIPDSRTGGMGRCMNFLAEGLRKKGHEVDLIFHETVVSPKLPRRLSYFLFPVAMLLTLYTRAKKEKKVYDLLAIHSLAAFTYVALRQFFKKLPPCVLVSYGSDQMRWELEKEEEKKGFRKIRLFSKFFYPPFVIAPVRYATRHADHVLVGSREEIDYHEKQNLMDRRKITFIPNGVSEDFFIERDYNRPPRKLLFLGGWEWRKGIFYLAEAFVQLAGEFPDITLSLVGIGVAPQKALEFFPENIRSRVHVTPYVPAEKIPGVYAEHDLFIFPTLFESMSLVIPEAMASGMPIVGTRVCGLPDIVENGVSGFLVEPRKSQELIARVRELLQSRSKREQFGKAARHKALEVRWDLLAGRCAVMYEQTIREARS